MLKNELIKLYAECHNMTFHEAREMYDTGELTQYQIFDNFLKYEGIIGYTSKIILAFREAFDIKI